MVPKFRAWDIKYKMMMRVNQIDFEEKTVWLEADNGDHENRHTLTREFKDVILMQSTGLKDRNSVEIFEGDVLSGWIPSHWHSGLSKFDKKVEYDTRLGRFNFDGRDIDVNENEYLEAIGNVWENPELLEVVR